MDDRKWINDPGELTDADFESDGVTLKLRGAIPVPKLRSVPSGEASRTDKRVMLRCERRGRDSRHLSAYLDAAGNLHIDGHDLGPSAGFDGEYEWYQTIRSEHVPQLGRLLGAAPGEDLLDILVRRWSGARCSDLERVLRESDIPLERFVWC